MSAAVAAARLGVRTALVHDRPVLGGNASSEHHVPITGANSAAGAPSLDQTRGVSPVRCIACVVAGRIGDVASGVPRRGILLRVGRLGYNVLRDLGYASSACGRTACCATVRGFLWTSYQLALAVWGWWRCVADGRMRWGGDAPRPYSGRGRWPPRAVARGAEAAGRVVGGSCVGPCVGRSRASACWLRADYAAVRRAQHRRDEMLGGEYGVLQPVHADVAGSGGL